MMYIGKYYNNNTPLFDEIFVLLNVSKKKKLKLKKEQKIYLTFSRNLILIQD